MSQWSWYLVIGIEKYEWNVWTWSNMKNTICNSNKKVEKSQLENSDGNFRLVLEHHKIIKRLVQVTDKSNSKTASWLFHQESAKVYDLSLHKWRLRIDQSPVLLS